MKINHAILHVFDFVSCVNVYAQEELDLASKNAKRYVTSHAKKALGNMDSKRGEFAEDSMFAEELRAYFRGQRGFVDLSVQVAEFIAGELGRMEKSESADLLVLDFEDDPDTTVRAMDDEEAVAAYEARGKRYFAFMLLESKQAYMHEVGYGESGAQRVDVARHHAILPNPSQKVASFAVVESKTLSVSFCDKEREIAGERRWLIPDGLLQCSMEASSKEVFDTVARLVEEVAEEYGANTAVAVSKAKAYVAENADESD
ncbi:nucleoid-associated protein, partial [Gordonibacter pamelaeae]